MYKIQLLNNDGTIALIYDQTAENPLPVIGPKLSLEVNEAGSLGFTLVYSHPLFDSLEPLSSYVRVLDDGEEIFYGRVLQKTKPTLTGQVSFQCEGALTFLLDSEVEPDPKDRNGNQQTRTLKAETFLRWCIDQHNAETDDDRRKFFVGIVNAEKKDKEDVHLITSYTQTKSIIESNILNIYGGFLRTRRAPFVDYIGQFGQGNIDLNNRVVVHNPDGTISTERSFSFQDNNKEVLIPLIVNGQVLSEDDAIAYYRSSGKYLGKFDNVTDADVYAMRLHERQDWYYNGRSQDPVLYIDWIEEYEQVNQQLIKIGKNVEDQTNQFDSNQLFTVIRPVGSDGVTLTEKTIDLYSAADIEKYGRIVKTIEFKNATTEEQLRTEAQEYVERMSKSLFINSSVQYVDMHYLDGTKPKVRLGDRFTNLYGLEGTEMIAAGMELDFEHIENDTIDFKNPKSLKPDMTPEGNLHSGNRKLSRSHGRSSGMALKYYHELQDYAYINVNKLDIQAKDLGIYVRGKFTEISDQFIQISSRADEVDNMIHTLTRQFEDVNYNVTQIQGTAIYQNGDFISDLAGKFEVWTDEHGHSTVHLKDGAEMAVDDLNGGIITIGSLNDQLVEKSVIIDEMSGSALWTQRNQITGVVGEFSIDYTRVPDPDHPGEYLIKKTLVIESGGGMKIKRNGVEYGLYDEGNMTAGLLVQKLNGQTFATLNGQNIKVGSSYTLNTEVTATQLARFGLVDPITGELTGGMLVQKLDGQPITTINGQTIIVGDENTVTAQLTAQELARFGLVDPITGELTGGMIVHKLDGQPITTINGKSITVGGTTTINAEVTATQLARFGLVDPDSGTLTGGMIVNKLADGTANTKISGALIEIDSSTHVTLNDILDVGQNSVRIKDNPFIVGPALSGVLLTQAGAIQAEQLQIRQHNPNVTYTFDSNTVPGMIKAVDISSNDGTLSFTRFDNTYALTIKKEGNNLVFEDKDGHKITFSKAASIDYLTGTWSGANLTIGTSPSTTHTYTIKFEDDPTGSSGNLSLCVTTNGTPSIENGTTLRVPVRVASQLTQTPYTRTTRYSKDLLVTVPLTAGATFTSNGTYDVPSGSMGYKKVKIAVPDIDYLTGSWSSGLFPLTINTSPSSSHSYRIRFEDDPTGSSGDLSLCVTTNGNPTIQNADTLSVPIRVASQLTQSPYTKTTRYTKNLSVTVPLVAGTTFTSNGTYSPSGSMGYKAVKVNVPQLESLNSSWSGANLTIGTTPSFGKTYLVKFEDDPTGSSGNLSLCVTTNGSPTIKTGDTLSVPVRVASQLTQSPYTKTTRYTKDLLVSVPLTGGATFTSNGTYAPSGTMGYRAVKVNVPDKVVSPTLTSKWTSGTIVVTSNPAATNNVSMTVVPEAISWASASTATSAKTRGTIKLKVEGTQNTYIGKNIIVNADSIWNDGANSGYIGASSVSDTSQTYTSVLAYDRIYKFLVRVTKADGSSATSTKSNAVRYWKTPVDRYEIAQSEFTWTSDADMYDPSKRMLDASTSPSGHTANYKITATGSGADGSGASVKFGFRTHCRNSYSRYYSFDGAVTRCYKDGYVDGYNNGKGTASNISIDIPSAQIYTTDHDPVGVELTTLRKKFLQAKSDGDYVCFCVDVLRDGSRVKRKQYFMEP